MTEEDQQLRQTGGVVSVRTANPAWALRISEQAMPIMALADSAPQLLSALDQLVPNLALQLAMAKPNGRRIASTEMPYGFTCRKVFGVRLIVRLFPPLGKMGEENEEEEKEEVEEAEEEEEASRTRQRAKTRGETKVVFQHVRHGHSACLRHAA